MLTPRHFSKANWSTFLGSNKKKSFETLKEYPVHFEQKTHITMLCEMWLRIPLKRIIPKVVLLATFVTMSNIQWTKATHCLTLAFFKRYDFQFASTFVMNAAHIQAASDCTTMRQ